MNAIKAIKPYKPLGVWVFDDPGVGLVQEPFVEGADNVIAEWVKDFYAPDKGVSTQILSRPVSPVSVFVEMEEKRDRR